MAERCDLQVEGNPFAFLISRQIVMNADIVWVHSLLKYVTDSTDMASLVNESIFGFDKPVVLRAIQDIRHCLLPEWNAMSADSNWKNMHAAAKHLTSLLEKSGDIFYYKDGKIPASVCKSYAEWYALLQKMASSSGTCSGEVSLSPVMRSDIKRSTAKTDRKHRRDDSDIPRESRGSDRKYSPNPKSSPDRVQWKISEKKRRSKACRSGSSESDESSQLSSDTSVSSMSPVRARRAKSVRRYRGERDVFKPLPFKGESQESFRRYLRTYETYFCKRYGKDDHQMSMALADFLTGGLLHAYETVGGAEMRYHQLKKHLIDYYDSQKVKGTRQWQKELSTARMTEDESVLLYGMRLKRLASKAYPDSERCRSKELHYNFVKTVPRWFRRIIDMREAMNEQMGLRRKLDWDELMKLTKKEEQRRRKECSGSSDSDTKHRTVYYSRKANDNEWTANKQTTYDQNGGLPRRECSFCGKLGHTEQFCFQKQGRKQQTGSGCGFCGKSNHSIENCRRKRGECLVCGSVDHFAKDCPSRKSNSNSLPSLCPSCSGPHLGKDCPGHYSEKN